jgi:hypothetical protein
LRQFGPNYIRYNRYHINTNVFDIYYDMSHVRRMKPNPGGQLSPEQIVGRDGLIAEIWEILEGRSIYMNDLRRIGKTQIMVKMHAAPIKDWITIKCDLGGIHTAGEFATQAFRMSHEALGKKKRTLRRMGDLLGKIKGMEVAGLVKLPDGTAAPWKEVLRRTFADLEEEMVSLGPNQRILLLWDEVPFLLENISKREGAKVAMEVLDILRALGQDHDHIRLLLTGSIGLHHILNELKKQGYNGSPLNRMEHIQPGPLTPEDSVSLARTMLTKNTLRCDDVDKCASKLASAVGHVPFYIHRLISRMPKTGKSTTRSIQTLLDQEITSDNNDWDLQHYRDRLKPYYGADEKLALQILDAVAIGGVLGFDAIKREVSAQAPVDDERLRDLLKFLCKDHYLVRNKKNEYSFYLALIRRWWRLDRSL